VLKPIKFLKHFLISPNTTGALTPSSEGLSHLITDTAELANTSMVIEFGTGTGVFTEKILQKISDKTQFFALEINSEFAEQTRQKCPKALVYEDSAVNARTYLEAAGFQACDRIICGLPWASFDEGLQNALLQTTKDVLKPGGKLLTFAYVSSLLLPAGIRFRKKLYATFPKVSTTRTIWMNIPPAFVYCAEK